MALNVKKLYPLEHPPVTHPVKNLRPPITREEDPLNSNEKQYKYCATEDKKAKEEEKERTASIKRRLNVI